MFGQYSMYKPSQLFIYSWEQMIDVNINVMPDGYAAAFDTCYDSHIAVGVAEITLMAAPL